MRLIFNKIPLISPVEEIKTLEQANQFIEDYTHFWTYKPYKDDSSLSLMYDLTSNLNVKSYIDDKGIELDALLSIRLLESISYRLSSFIKDMMNDSNLNDVPSYISIQYHRDPDPDSRTPITVYCSIKKEDSSYSKDYNFFTTLLEEDLGYRDICTKTNPFKGFKKVLNFSETAIEINLKDFDSIYHSLFNCASNEDFLKLKKMLEIEKSLVSTTISSKINQVRF